MNLNIKALSRSTISTIGLVTLFTVWGELAPPLKSAIASVGGHHWTGKSILSVIIFIALYFFYKKVLKGKADPEKEVWMIIGSAVTGTAILLGFFLWHYFSL